MTAEEGKAEASGEKSKTKAPAWMFNNDGVAYAPWMVDQFDPEVCRSFAVRDSIVFNSTVAPATHS